MFSSLTGQASAAIGVDKLQTPNFDLASGKKLLNTDSFAIALISIFSAFEPSFRLGARKGLES